MFFNDLFRFQPMMYFALVGLNVAAKTTPSSSSMGHGFVVGLIAFFVAQIFFTWLAKKYLGDDLDKGVRLMVSTVAAVVSFLASIWL